jgi:hypothetical protein
VFLGLALIIPAGRLAAQDVDRGRIRAAIERALPPVQKGLAEFQARWVPPKGFPLPEHLKKVGCISCHHEGIGLSTLSFLRDRGFAVDEGLADRISGKLHSAYEGFEPLYRRALSDPKASQEADFFGDIAVQIGYMLGGLLDSGHAPDRSSETAARLLLKFQQEEGSWTCAFDREPMQSSDFTTTAMAARIVKAYIPSDGAGTARESVRKAREWLESNRPQTIDDLAFRLLGLAWTDAPRAARDEAVRDLKAAQRGDGGWAQLASSKESDAYATGLALLALHRGGAVEPCDCPYRRGVAFLLSTQRPDGTWFVRKWSHAYNQYFDAGFPFGKNQFISLPATCYAMMALAVWCDPAAQRVSSPFTAVRPTAGKIGRASLPAENRLPGPRGPARPGTT